MDKYNNFLFDNLIVENSFFMGLHLKYCNKYVKKKIK